MKVELMNYGKWMQNEYELQQHRDIEKREITLHQHNDDDDF